MPATTAAAAAKLFHPKQKKGELAKQSIATRRPPTKASPSALGQSPKPATPEPTAGATPRLPDGPYTEFKLVSSAVNGWKYDVMRFESRKPVDILSWARPVKLNRKDTRKTEPGDAGAEPTQVAVKPMLGPDGKPVIGTDGRIVMLDAEGKPIHNNPANGKQKQGGGGGGGRKKMQKKTRQVFKVAEPIRQLRKEERYPWVIEDASGQETWVATFEEANKAETHAFFMPASGNTFKFVPAHRWYKFQKKPKYDIPSLEEAEKLMSTISRNKDPGRWLLRHNKEANPSTLAMFKEEASTSPSDSSLGPGGRRLRIKKEDDLFGDDEDGMRRPRNEMDADYDEVPYEEEFQDDEEKTGLYEDDELTKEMEERIQKEYMSANKQRDGQVDDDDEEEPEPKLTGAGKSMKKLVGRHEKNDAYDSDDDEGNPYASEAQEIVTNEPAVKQQATQSRAPSQPPASGATGPASVQQAQPATPFPGGSGSQPGSRATSPTPSQSGHSLVAQRATSPKVPKPKPTGTSRASSPLAQDARAAGISANRVATSPPPGQPSSSQKRKADDNDSPSTGAPSGAARPPKKSRPDEKKRKAVDKDGNPIPLKDQMVIEWLRTTENATTRDCITHFTPFLRDKTDKENFTKLIRDVAILKGGVLVLRPQFRYTSLTPTAMDTSA
ncbi:hypothetical protein K488DRAFT_40295 [Vararia minispora EC-137]|uniref:Uncharacterized protein n=1 Tax=Vararia minispora EC-137 TaxID=1314806 RepID=A0ACB8QYE4_9AGAM|nr:hypothetical protein K488DRAFT_40295 [Vararia minispora EC-137]